MNVRNLSGLLLSLFTLVVLGCGGGGGAGSGSSTPVSTVSGEASKGPIIGGDVQIFAINADGTLPPTPLTTTPAKVTTRLPFGNYSAVISYEGPVKVVVTGGSYTDEATKLPVDFTGKSLSAVVAKVTGSAKVSVTPFTEMAVRKTAGAALTADSINKANIAVADALGLNGVDIVTAMPSTNSKYKFNLAVFSQAVGQVAGHDATDMINLLTDTASAIDNTGKMDPAVSTKFDTAASLAFDNPKIDKTGVDGSAVSRVTLTASPSSTALINSTVTISASVTKISGGPVADKTAVTFTASAGTVSAVTTTTNGVATATLSGISSPQTVSITASAGNVKSPEININFVDPASQSIITVTDVAGTHVKGSPVTITANVKTKDGVAVPVGTTVNFEIIPSVTGATLSASSSSTDASGNASVTLNSTVDGAVTVKITAAQAIGSHTITFTAGNPTLVTVKVRTTGTLPAGTTIGGIKATVSANPSTGLTIASDPNGVSSDVSLTGAGAGSTLITNSSLPPVGGAPAAVTLALINTGGIQTGEFATLKYHVAAGSIPTANNFSVALNGSAIDTLSANISGIGVAILSVTIQ